jgi:hypothetical protein
MSEEEWLEFELRYIQAELLDVRPCVVARRTGIDIDEIMAIRNGTEANPDIVTLNVLDVYLMRNGEQ